MYALIDSLGIAQNPQFIIFGTAVATAIAIPWSSVLELIRQHQLTAFFTLAMALTGLAFIPYYLSAGDSIPWFTFGPAIAALLVTWFAGGRQAIKSLLAPVIRWKVPPAWYAAAIGIPLAAQLVAILLNPLFGSPMPTWSNIPPLSEMLPKIALFAVFSGPLGEEIGWRGFALPRLLERHTAFTASLVLGSLWAIWHLPLVLVGDFSTYGAFMPVIAAFVFTWLFQNTRGSVLLAILMHVSHQNAVRYLGKVFVGDDYLRQQWIAVAIWLAIVAVILSLHGLQSFRQDKAGPARKLCHA